MVQIKSLEAAKIMKIKWLVLGCIDAKFWRSIRYEEVTLVLKGRLDLISEIAGGMKKKDRPTRPWRA